MTESIVVELNPRHHFRSNGVSSHPSSSYMIFFLFSLILVYSINPVEAGSSGSPLICNRDTAHQCVCEAGERPPLSPPDCEQLIQGHELAVVDMRARHVNLEAQLHTSENYESYFKRRIAQIVSSYCENQVNECPGVSLKITKENVILLRVEKDPGNVTRILFAIVKSAAIASIEEEDIIDPNKIKVILGSQAAPLSRILGGIRLDSVRVSRIRREGDMAAAGREDADNTNLLRIATGVGLFFLICYIVGIWKICKYSAKRKRRRNEQEGLAATTTTPNYGTLKDRKPSRNGSSALRDIEGCFESEYKSIDESIPSRDPNEPRMLTERQAKFMFMCDPSQLPREPTFNSQIELETTSASAPLIYEVSRHEVIEEDEEHPGERRRVSEEIGGKEEPTEIPVVFTEGPSEIEIVPELVIVPSMSLNSESSMASELSPTEATAKCHLRSESPPIERPQSRRGSRVDEEEIDLTELGVPTKTLFTDLVIPDGIQAEYERPESVEKWSSSEGDVDVYYKMSDDEEIKGDDWERKQEESTAKTKTTVKDDEESDADNEEEERPPEDTDAFVYERLREEASPLPPPHNESTNS